MQNWKDGMKGFERFICYRLEGTWIFRDCAVDLTVRKSSL